MIDFSASTAVFRGLSGPKQPFLGAAGGFRPSTHQGSPRQNKAIRTGRITPEADGTIDPARADAEWERNTEAPNPPGTRQRAVTAKAPSDGDAPNGGGMSLLQARTVNEVVKAQTNKVRLARLKGELVDRNQAIAHVFKLARTERDAWLNWPARISAQMAAELGVDPQALHVAIDAAVRQHLMELGEIGVRVD